MPGGTKPQRVIVREDHGSCHSIREIWVDRNRVRVKRSSPRLREVRVEADPGAVPIGGARVVLASSDGPSSRVRSVGYTDAGGRTTVAVADADEPASVIVKARGYASASLPLPDTDEILTVRLKKGHGLRLQVFDPRGNPAIDTLIAWRVDEVSLLDSVHRTDATGSVSLSDLPSGAVRLRILHPDFLDRDYLVVVEPGEIRRRIIRAEPGFRVLGRVLLPDGKPAVGAVVTLRDTMSRLPFRPRTAVTGAAGRFEIRGLPWNQRMRLSARFARAGSSFISAQILLQPDESPWEIRLKSEDPRLPGRGK